MVCAALACLKQNALINIVVVLRFNAKSTN